MPAHEKARELFTAAIQARDDYDLQEALKKFTMSLSYEGSAEAYLERARTYLLMWQGGNDPELEAILNDTKKAAECDEKGVFAEKLDELFTDLRAALNMLVISLNNDDPDPADLHVILHQIESVKKFCDYASLEEELAKVEEAATSVLAEREAQKRQWNLDTVYEFFSSNNPNRASENFDLAGGAATEEEVEAFEKRIGFALPDDFREFTLTPLGGLYMAAREELWPRAQVGDVGPFWTFLYGINVFGLSADVPEWLDMRIQYDELQSLEVEDLVPFMRLEGDSDMYCFNREGKIVKWYHDDPDEREVIDLTFPQLLMDEINDLRRRLRRKLELAMTGSTA